MPPCLMAKKGFLDLWHRPNVSVLLALYNGDIIIGLARNLAKQVIYYVKATQWIFDAVFDLSFFSTIKEKNVNFSLFLLQHFPDCLLNISRNNRSKAFCIITNAMELNMDNLSLYCAVATFIHPIVKLILWDSTCSALNYYQKDKK